ncbi:hypothetical protein BGZ80_009941 [Entomortierella chlamydospora]|uniref:Uncharacterized protein n=1 Tax=Entomortierella chlamydospora TaxID=101097 RepID=A0A9P6MVL4_9FUNG|nr:hypothetical protein BGZ79_002309 [Entomortierella chlamydospora]KAG0015284.1 hypothetical protein BGZ80_009941 [Entomortierella chlamydospora]
MGQSNSTLTNTPPPQPSPSPSPMPSLEDVRDVPYRILSTTNKALGDLGGTIVSIAKPVISSLPGRKKTPPVPLLPPPPPPSLASQIALWVRANPGKTVLGSMFISAAVIGGSLSYKAGKMHQKQAKKRKIVRGTDGTKRELVVVTNVATTEGAVLALDLDECGFIVFVGVPDQSKADEVLSWGRTDIHPVIIADPSNAGDLDNLISRVSNFLDEHNGPLRGTHEGVVSSNTGTPTPSFHSPVFSASSSFMLVGYEALALSAGDIRLSEAEAERSEFVPIQHSVGKYHKNEPQFRLSAVIVNPYETVVGSIEDLDVEAWRQCLDINVTGTILVVQRLLPLLKKTLTLSTSRRSPRIILITSAVAGNIGLPNQSAICASHHAIVSVADSLRREIQHKGIDVVSIRLGIMESSRSTAARKIKIVNAGNVGLFSSSYTNSIEFLKSAFKQPLTSQELCKATFNAVVDANPPITQAVGRGSFEYSFVGWAVPKRVIDWSIRCAAVRARTATPVARDTTL